VSDQPLGEAIRGSYGGFTPEHPERPPWLSQTPIPYEVAQTGDIAVVPLRLVGRVKLRGLEDRTPDQWAWTDPGDFVRQSWGLPPAAI
jgi:hypothetical protein